MLYVVGYKQGDNHDGLENGLENDNGLENSLGFTYHILERRGNLLKSFNQSVNLYNNLSSIKSAIQIFLFESKYFIGQPMVHKFDFKHEQ